MGTDSRTVTTQYDPAGDRSQISDSGGPTLSGTYYLDGLARTVSDGTVTTEYADDGLAQPTAREDVSGSTQPKTTYAYNAAELTSSLHFAPAGSNTITQTPSYDKAGRMTGAATTAGTLTLSYNADNTVALDKVVNGATTLLDWTYLYDPAKRITQQQFSGAGNGGTPNQSTLCYAYDLAGRLNTAFSAAAGTACGTAPAANVTWDHNGNRLTYGGPLTTIAATFAYNADDSIATEQDGTNAVRTYTDANFGGVSTDGCATYLYDGFYRTKSSTTTGCGQTTTTFTYDALDRTHTATTGSVTQTLHYDGWTSMTSLAVPSTGTLTSYALSQQGQPLGLQQGSTNQQLFDDGHASVGTVVSTAASVACTARFDPFGTALTLAGTVTPGTLPSTCNTGTPSSTPNTYFYRSARQDPGTGDYQLGSRLYDPSKDSFLVPDTSATGLPAQNPSVGSDPLLLNTYTYVNGDPVNLSDPTGHGACADNTNSCLPASAAGQANSPAPNKSPIVIAAGHAAENRPGPPPCDAECLGGQVGTPRPPMLASVCAITAEGTSSDPLVCSTQKLSDAITALLGLAAAFWAWDTQQSGPLPDTTPIAYQPCACPDVLQAFFGEAGNTGPSFWQLTAAQQSATLAAAASGLSQINDLSSSDPGWLKRQQRELYEGNAAFLRLQQQLLNQGKPEYGPNGGGGGRPPWGRIGVGIGFGIGAGYTIYQWWDSRSGGSGQ